MRIAVALFGLPRCSAVAAPSLEAQVLAPLRAHGELRVFYHLYRQDRVLNARSGEAGVLEASNYDFCAPFSGVLEDPAAALASPLLERLRGLGDPFDDGGASVGNAFLQLRSLAAVTRMAEAYDPDVMVFARPDVLFHGPLPAGLVPALAARPLACALPEWQWWGGYNDRFAACGRGVYRAYGGRLDRAEDCCRASQGPLHPEGLLHYALRGQGAQVLAMPFRFSRVRLNGVVKAESFNAYRLVGKSWGLRMEQVRARLRYRLTV